MPTSSRKNCPYNPYLVIPNICFMRLCGGHILFCSHKKECKKVRSPAPVCYSPFNGIHSPQPTLLLCASGLGSMNVSTDPRQHRRGEPGCGVTVGETLQIYWQKNCSYGYVEILRYVKQYFATQFGWDRPVFDHRKTMNANI